MRTRLRTVCMGSALTVLAGMNASAWAVPVPLVNAGFETDVVADPDGYVGGTTAWAGVFPVGGFGTGTHGTFDPDGTLAGAPFLGENNYFRVQASNNAGGPLNGISFAGGSQGTAASPLTTILANAIYTLSVDVGSDLRVAFPTPVPTNDTYVGFAGGPTILARLLNLGSGVGFGETVGVTLVSNAAVVAPGDVDTWTLTYTTNAAPANLGAGLAVQLFVQSNAVGGTIEALFDNVSLDLQTPTVPEPISAVLLGLGGLGLGALGRRRSA